MRSVNDVDFNDPNKSLGNIVNIQKRKHEYLRNIEKCLNNIHLLLILIEGQ